MATARAGEPAARGLLAADTPDTPIWPGAALCAFALLTIGAVGRFRPILEAVREDDSESSPFVRHPYVTLAIASFLALFVEVMLIRYAGSQLRIFAFYKNVPLIGAFLGLGLGCWLGRGSPRHAFAFLLWMLPLSFSLAYGSALITGFLDEIAAWGSSEHILGPVVPSGSDRLREWTSQLAMGVFSTAILIAIAGLFSLLGRLLGDAFDRLPRLHAYTLNILASLFGVLAFSALSFLSTPPVLWFCFGLLPFLWWLRGRARAFAGLALIAAVSLSVVPTGGDDDVVWSRYQKLVGRAVPIGVHQSPAYIVEVSNTFYQLAIDLSPRALARIGHNPFPHYTAALKGLPTPERVLVVGAGTGNDVAAALRARATQVDAVDIDPAIVEMGRRHHPERPYSDPRVHVIIDDARRAFRTLPPESYDAIVFGLLDSHTQLGISSVRLDNYVFTMEALADARRLLKPGGALILSAAVYSDWFRERFEAMLRSTCGQQVQVRAFGPWSTFRCRIQDGVVERDPLSSGTLLPTDDWPFLYLPRQEIPIGYLVVVGMLALASVAFLRFGGLDFRGLSPYYAHLFFLGAAFLLMEVVAINRLALLFGTTWLVSAVTIALVLSLIVAANLTVLAAGSVPYALSYTGLVLCLVVGYAIEPATVLSGSTTLALLYGLLVLSPVYFAGLVFARSFSAAAVAGPAIGANILGSVLGGWAEYASMWLGIRAMVMVALFAYAASLLALVAARTRGDTGGGEPPSGD